MADIIAIIPARGGSKGVLRKNLRHICGRPMIEYTMAAAAQSRWLSRTVVSTEDEEVASLCREAGFDVLLRPDELAQDDTPMIAVIRNVLAQVSKQQDSLPEAAVLLQPTSPLRQSSHIDAAIALFLAEKPDSVVSVTEVPHQYHPHFQFCIEEDLELRLHRGRPLSDLPTRRQDLSTTFRPNGAVYVFRSDLVFDRNTIYGERCLAYLMSPELSLDIDSEEDLFLAERFLSSAPHADNLRLAAEKTPAEVE